MLICIFLSLFLFSCSACVVSPNAVKKGLADFDYRLPVELEDLTKKDINGMFPEEIFIKTNTQTFCRDYQFCLVDGRIYYKKMKDAKYSNPGKNEEYWQLVNGTGLPFPTKKNDKTFVKANRIVEIAADADSLFAFNSEGGMYQMFTNDLGPGKPFVWYCGFGWPEKVQLVQNNLVKNKRAWASGARRQDVLWHEDINGNPHHYGTMGIETIYFLAEDGQQIRFTDSGLPADFSRSILGPERGAFIAENLSASADTMFVINKAGIMYTRLADFDTLGCDPMFFKYTYEKLPQKYSGYQYLSNYSPWALPSEPWLLQPKILLKEKARLTKHITILQNGHGNAARELRVAGLNENGKTGFYSKPIFAKKTTDWTFVEVPLNLHEEDFLPVSSEGVSVDAMETLNGEKQEFSYQGFLWENGIKLKEISCSIPDFPISEGNCTLNISYKDETKTFVVHPVEIWTYVFRNNPGLDGSPKNFFITFDYEQNMLESRYPEFEILLKKIFADKNRVLFSCHGSATDKYFKISVEYKGKFNPEKKVSAKSSLEIPIKKNEFMEKSSFTFFLANQNEGATADDLSRRTVIFYGSPSLMQYKSDGLRLHGGTEITIENRAILDNAVFANLEYRQMLENEIKLYKKIASKADISRWGYNIADIFTAVTFLNQINFPKIKNITSFGGKIMEENAKTYKNQEKTNAWLYSHLKELLDLRINVYKKMQDEFSDGKKSVVVPKNLQDSFVEYYNVNAGIPMNLDGFSCINKECPSEIQILAEADFFPGFCISLKNNDSYYIIVELKDSVSEIFYRKEKISVENPLKLKASFFIFSDSEYLPEDLENASSWKGWVFWDGKNMTVEANVGLFKKQVVFESFN